MKLEQRHWVFLGLFILITLVMLIKVRPDISVSNQTRKMYAYIDSLPSGSILLISFDHEASSLPEIRPLAQAVLSHAFEKGHRLIGMALFAEGTAIGYRMMQDVAAQYGRNPGTDFVYLGFKPQFIAAILAMGESFEQTFPEDYLGNPYRSHELLTTVSNYDDIAAMISIADGSLTTHWIEYAGSRYNLTVLGAVTAAMVTTYDPYLASGQMTCMVGGLRGAAEYESLLGIEGGGSRGMLAQTASHLYIILLVVIGNVIYFRSRRGSK